MSSQEFSLSSNLLKSNHLFHVSLHKTQSNQVGGIIIPTLQMKKLRRGEVTAGK